MGIKKFLEDEFGFSFDSKDELKKKRLKKLIEDLQKRKAKILKLLSKDKIDKKAKTDLQETLDIIASLEKQKISDLRKLILKEKKGKK